MQVPTYGGPQVTPNAAPAAYQNPNDFTGGDRAVSQFASQVGDMADRIVSMQNQDLAWRTETNEKINFANWEAQNKPKFQGAAAAGTIDPMSGQSTGTYADAVQQYWAGRMSELGQGLPPAQQKIIDRTLGTFSANTVGAATQYTLGELQKSHLESWMAANNADTQVALHAGTTVAADTAAASIMQRNAQFAVQQGHINPDTGMADQNWLQQQNLHDLTALHANMIAQLQQTDTAAAREYFISHQSQIDGAQLDNINHSLTVAEASTKGVGIAADAMKMFLPADADPTRGETPLNVTAMQAEIDKETAGNPALHAAASAELASRINAWKTTEQQYQTDAINSIEAGIAQGKGLPWAMQQPAWTTLAGKSQAAITDHLQAKSYQALVQANAVDARADAQAARDDRAMGRQNYSTFLDWMSNPEKLAAATPDQVQALLPTLGDALTRSLVEKKATLNTQADVQTARIDQNVFHSLAVNSFGLIDPKDPSASKQDKDRYGNLQYNVDFMLQQMQTAKGMRLTNAEKEQAMRNEMARTVTVDPGFLSSNMQVPVIAMTPEQAQNLVIPYATQQKIGAALYQMSLKYPGDPRYAPTAANVKATYLRSVSPMAAPIFDGQ